MNLTKLFILFSFVTAFVAVMLLGCVMNSRHAAIIFKAEIFETQLKLNSYNAKMVTPQIEEMNKYLHRMKDMNADPVFGWITSNMWDKINPITITP